MNTMQLFTTALAYGCTAGPLLGIGLAVLAHVLRGRAGRHFQITIGNGGNHDK